MAGGAPVKYGRRDTTHAAIRDAFRQCGCQAIDIGGVFDLLVMDSRQRNHLIDCKTALSKAGRWMIPL